MRSPSASEKTCLLVLAFFLLLFSACGGGTSVKSDSAAPAKADSSAAPSDGGPKEAPLGKKYDRIVFQQFEYEPQIEADYPGAAAECEKSALEAVIAKKTFASAQKETAGAKPAGALLVKTRITSLRIVSTAARMWGGAFAGSSEMSLQMKLIDASTGAVIREKVLSTNNNPWAASWTGGTSDRTLPADLGKMVAEYLAAVQPEGGRTADPAPPVSETKAAEPVAPKPAPVKEEVKPAPAAAGSAPATQAKMLVVTKTASVRSEPGTKGKIVTTLKRGTKIESLERSGSWYKIKLPTGATGWVFHTLVKEEK